MRKYAIEILLKPQIVVVSPQHMGHTMALGCANYCLLVGTFIPKLQCSDW